MFESLFFDLPVRWVNGWEEFRLHQVKPAALAKVAALGARVPATLVTNDPERVQEFLSQFGPCIVKPVQGGDHAALLKGEDVRPQQLTNLELAPVTLQEYLPGTNVRVFVAGDVVQGCEIRTRVSGRLPLGGR